jgi:hypothetical protein
MRRKWNNMSRQRGNWKLLTAAAFLFTTACSHIPTETERETEREAASSAWVDCVVEAVIRFDDGKTDPVSIAYGIAPQCAVQYSQLTRITAQQLSSTQSGRVHILNLMKDDEIKSITSAILIHRSPPNG